MTWPFGQTGTTRLWLAAVTTALACTLAACGGGGDDSTSSASAVEKGKATYTVGGTVTLAAPLPAGTSIAVVLGTATGTVWQSISSSGPYVFNQALSRRDDFSVFVRDVPPNYTCTVTGTISGKIARDNVTNANVSCTYDAPVLVPARFNVTGLPSPMPEGQALTMSLLRSQFDEVPLATSVLTSDGSYAFTDVLLPSGSTAVFAVTGTPVGYTCFSSPLIALVSPTGAPVSVTCRPVTPQ